MLEGSEMAILNWPPPADRQNIVLAGHLGRDDFGQGWIKSQPLQIDPGQAKVFGQKESQRSSVI